MGGPSHRETPDAIGEIGGNSLGLVRVLFQGMYPVTKSGIVMLAQTLYIAYFQAAHFSCPQGRSDRNNVAIREDIAIHERTTLPAIGDRTGDAVVQKYAGRPQQICNTTVVFG